MTRIAVFWSSIGLIGGVLGGVFGGILGRSTGGAGSGGDVDRHTVRRAAVWIAFVLVGAVPCAVVGLFLGLWLGNVATRGCQEMDCLSGLLWPIGGNFIGAMIGGTVGAVSARRFGRIPESPQP